MLICYNSHADLLSSLQPFPAQDTTVELCRTRLCLNYGVSEVPATFGNLHPHALKFVLRPLIHSHTHIYIFRKNAIDIENTWGF